jgi:phospholipase C
MTSLRALTFAAAGLGAATFGAAGCGGSASNGSPDMAMMSPDMTPLPLCGGDDCTTMSSIKHLVVVVQENHTFDNYFGQYCTAATGSNPTCNTGPGCCEAGPATEPGTSMSPPVMLTDNDNSGILNDRNHTHDCELAEIDGGKMDKFVTGAEMVNGIGCSTPETFAYAPTALIQPYLDMAAGGALADRYFQPYVGQSSANDMYFARAQFVFADNMYEPNALGHVCMTPGTSPTLMDFTGTTIADLLLQHGVAWAWYAGGYKAMKDANPQSASQCPAPPADCMAQLPSYPCLYDTSDVPFSYFPSTKDKDGQMRDFDAEFAADLAAGKLPPVAFVKGIGYKTEHPGGDVTISAGVTFVKSVVDAVAASPAAASTLVIVTYDEGGGFFDHVAPPADSPVDHQAYGTRVPTWAVGTFAKKNYVSHVTMEHSSIVKFIEWNWLGGATGQLMGRDAVVNNVGDLLDGTKTGTVVPAN